MRIASVIVVLSLSAMSASADDYIKDGKLTHTLKLTQLQGGFAGNTGFEYTIEPDGAWSVVSLFNKKTTPKDKGKLSAKELETLAALLTKNELDKLPAKSGKPPGANPHTIMIEFGKKKATLVGQTPPKVDANNPGSVDSRFAAIYQGMAGTLKGGGKKNPDSE